MSGKWTFRYGSAAVLMAIAIIVVALFANASFFKPSNPSATFAVMLTDPPTVPAGTTVLNLTYSDISLHVAYPNGTTEWLPVVASGTVNLFSLVNMSKTLASTTIPVGSKVDKVQFAIVDVEAEVNGVTYNVTALSNSLVVKVDNSEVNQTLSGVLIDFNPTLVQIQAIDADGTLVNYYVLVPSATATIIGDLSEDHVKVGTIIKLGEHNKVRLVKVEEEFSNNVTFVAASLTLNGNVTTLSVTLKNQGNFVFRIFGMTLHGEFNSTRTLQYAKNENNNDNKYDKQVKDKTHPETIPFKVNDTSLIPLFGTSHERDEEDKHRDKNEETSLSALILQPGQTVTLTFSDVIILQTDENHNAHSITVITPIVDGNFTLRLMGEGSQSFNFTAKY